MKRILITIVTASIVLVNVPALAKPLDIDRIKIVTMHGNHAGVPVSLPWDFDIGVHVFNAGKNARKLDHIHITKPGDSVPFYIMFEGKPGVWEFESSPSDFPSLEAVRALYPEGVYTFEFHSSKHKLLRTISLDYSGLSLPTSPVDFTYPSVDGQTNVSTNPTFTWNAGVGGNALLVSVEDELTEDTAYQGAPVPTDTLSVSPGPLLPNRTYGLSVAVLSLKDWTGGGWPTTRVKGDKFAYDLRIDNRNRILFTTVDVSP